MGHMQSAVQPGRGLLPSYRLAPGPAPNGSCGIQVAAACGLPPSLLDRAAEVAQRAEQVGQCGGPAGGDSPDGRQPLQQLNTLQQVSQSPPPAKRRRLPPLPAAEEEQQEALAAVRAVVQAALQGEAGAGQQLVRLQAQVAAALAAGEL
jgi:DNA mismatch repair ATPase MutS